MKLSRRFNAIMVAYLFENGYCILCYVFVTMLYVARGISAKSVTEIIVAAQRRVFYESKRKYRRDTGSAFLWKLKPTAGCQRT